MRTTILALSAAAALAAAGSALAATSTPITAVAPASGSLASTVAIAQETPPKEADKPKYTIKQVMVDVHKGGLLKKVQGGKASKEEKFKLLEYYVAMYENKPKGSAESWSQLAGAAVAAAAKLVVDEKADPKILRGATNCKACHDQHK